MLGGERRRQLGVIDLALDLGALPVQLGQQAIAQAGLQGLVVGAALLPRRAGPRRERRVRRDADHLDGGAAGEAVGEVGVLGRRERQVRHRQRRRRIGEEPGHAAIVIVVGVDPQVRALEAERRGVVAEPGVQRHVGERRRRAGDRRLEVVARGDLARHQLAEGERQAGVADHPRRADLLAAGQAHADRAIALDDDLRDLGRGDHRAAGGLDAGQHRLGDPRRAADRVGAAAEVVAHQHRVHEPAGLGRRQAVVAVLPGQHRGQAAIAGQGRHHLAHGLARVAHRRPAQDRAGDRAQHRRQRLLEEELLAGVDGLADELQVAIDRVPLVGEALVHRLAEPLAARDERVAIVADDDRVVDVAQRGPAELAVAQVIERAPEQRALAVDVADVVHADVPLVAGAMERVGEAAGGVVPLEHQHALAGVARQHRRGGEAAEAAADDDRVPTAGAGIGEAVLLVRGADAGHARLRGRAGAVAAGRNPASS